MSGETTDEPVRRKRFFQVEGDGFRPTGLSTSPWRRDAQNGLALGLLIAHTLERRPEFADGRLARLTIDILRPAPADFTTVAWRVARGGRRVQLLEGELVAGGVLSCRASALFVAPTGAPPPPQAAEPPPVPPEAANAGRVLPAETGLDALRVSSREKAVDGRNSMWLRVNAEVTPGATPSAIGAAVAISDFGGSTLRRYSGLWTYPNLDIDVHFSRAPRGEWVHASSAPMLLGRGIGVIDHRLSDREGVFARAHQTMYFGRVPEALA